jgi:hypothetical protein
MGGGGASGAAAVAPLFNCLVRTHHITSRKKLQRVRRAAAQLRLDYLLVRSGGSPGLMFAQSRDEAALAAWLAAVQGLRYKDFRCVARPAPSVAASHQAQEAKTQVQASSSHPSSYPSSPPSADGVAFRETESVAEFGRELDGRGLTAWWKRAMGYAPDGG